MMVNGEFMVPVSRRIESINLITDLKSDIKNEKARITGSRLLEIMRTDEFRDAVLNMDRNYWLQGETGIFKKLTNLESYNLLMSGKEEWNLEADYEIDIKMVGYWGKIWSKVIAYMIPGKPEIYQNLKKFNGLSKKKLCGNMCHEWCHTLGGRHSGKMFRLSFEYYMNKVVEEIYEKMYGREQEVKLVRACNRRWYRLFVKKCYLVRE